MVNKNSFKTYSYNIIKDINYKNIKKFIKNLLKN